MNLFKKETSITQPPPKENPKKRKEKSLDDKRLDDKSSSEALKRSKESKVPEPITVAFSILDVLIKHSQEMKPEIQATLDKSKELIKARRDYAVAFDILDTVLVDIIDNGAVEKYYSIELIKAMIPDVKTLYILYCCEHLEAAKIEVENPDSFDNGLLVGAIRGSRYDIAKYILNLDKKMLIGMCVNTFIPIEHVIFKIKRRISLYKDQDVEAFEEDNIVKILHLFVSELQPEWLAECPVENDDTVQERISKCFLTVFEYAFSEEVEALGKYRDICRKSAALLFPLVTDEAKQGKKVYQFAELESIGNEINKKFAAEEKATATSSSTKLSGNINRFEGTSSASTSDFSFNPFSKGLF